MKKFIVLVALVLTGSLFTVLQAQESSSQRSSDRKAQRDAERARQRAAEEVSDAIAYQEALSALKQQQFVIEADQVMFRNGQTAYVTSNTNFVLVNEQRGTVQVSFNTPNPGPNGIGGVTVDGTMSDMKTSTDKKGNTNCSFNIQGVGISAQVFLTLSKGSDKATVSINPNFNSNNITVSGSLVPLSQSNIFKGRSW